MVTRATTSAAGAPSPAELSWSARLARSADQLSSAHEVQLFDDADCVELIDLAPLQPGDELADLSGHEDHASEHMFE